MRAMRKCTKKEDSGRKTDGRVQKVQERILLSGFHFRHPSPAYCNCRTRSNMPVKSEGATAAESF